MDHASAPLLPRRFPLVLEPRIRPWKWSDGFPGIWIKKMIPFTLFAGGCKAVVQTLVPNADISAGDYLPTPHHTRLSVRSDAGTIVAGCGGGFFMPECGSGVTTFRFIVALDSPNTEPASSDCQGARYRFRFRKNETGGDCAAGVVDVNDLRIRQGTTTKIGPFDHGTIGTSYTTLNNAFNDAQVDNITDWGDVQMFADVDVCAADFFDGGPSIEFAWCEIELFKK